MAAARTLLDSAQRRVRDLATHQIPALRSCPGPISIQQALARDIRLEIAAAEKLTEQLEELSEDVDSELERIELLEQTTNIGSELTELRKEYRAALLASKRTIDANPAARREELLYSKTRQIDTSQSDDPVQQKANQVTAALRQTAELMKEELDRSVVSTQLLDESTQTLRSTTTLYQTYSSLLTTSNSLLTALEQANHLDRILILAALLFFALVCGYIVKKRILDKAVGGLVGAGSLAKRVAGAGAAKKGKEAAVSSVTSVAASVTAAAASAVLSRSSSGSSSSPSSSSALEETVASSLASATSDPTATSAVVIAVTTAVPGEGMIDGEGAGQGQDEPPAPSPEAVARHEEL